MDLHCRRCHAVLPVTVSEDGNRLILPGGAEIRQRVTVYCECGEWMDFVPKRRQSTRPY